MNKAACKTKRSYDSAEEAMALSLPGTDIYFCPACGKFHSTSKQLSPKQKKRQKLYGR